MPVYKSDLIDLMLELGERYREGLAERREKGRGRYDADYFLHGLDKDNEELNIRLQDCLDSYIDLRLAEREALK